MRAPCGRQVGLQRPRGLAFKCDTERPPRCPLGPALRMNGAPEELAPRLLPYAESKRTVEQVHQQTPFPFQAGSVLQRGTRCERVQPQFSVLRSRLERQLRDTPDWGAAIG